MGWGNISDKKKKFIDLTDEGYQWTAAARDEILPEVGMSLLDYYDLREGLAKSGKRVDDSVWITSLKDELLPKEKVERKGARTFEVPMMCYTMLMRKYFGAFGGFYRTHGGPILGHGIGLDRDAAWPVYLKHLKEMGDSGLAADYKSFDRSVTAQCLSIVLRMVEEFYYNSTEEERTVRSVLMHELIFSQHLFGNYVMTSTKGLMSGCWLTDVFNSMVNVLLWRTVFYRAHIQHMAIPPGLFDFTDNVCLLTYGDDVISSMTPLARRIMTGDFVQRQMVAMGFRVTRADKQEGKLEYVPICELEFLKSKFVEVHGIVLPQMPKQIAWRELNWLKTNTIDDVVLRWERIMAALSIMACHSEADYSDLCLQLEFIKEVPLMRLSWQGLPRRSHWLRLIRDKQMALCATRSAVFMKPSELLRGTEFKENPWEKEELA